MSILKRLILPLVMAASLAGAAGGLLLDTCTAENNWLFVNGGEFPGADGSLRYDAGAERLLLRYDFSGGGKYVAAIFRGTIPAAAERLTLTVVPETDVNVNVRLTDATGRVFQKHGTRLPGGVAADLTVSAGENWSGAWGGEENPAPVRPWKEVWLMAGADDPGMAGAGAVRLDKLTADGAELAVAPFTGEPFAGTLGDAAWQGRWLACAEGAVLELNCLAGDEEVAFAFDFPQNGRSLVQRWRVAPGAAGTLLLPFPARNPRNVYAVDMKAVAGDETYSRTLKLRGDQADAYFFGPPRASGQIRTARFGSCAHYSYGRDPLGPFKGWYPWKQLIDDMALCGMKIIRDGGGIEKDEATGRYRVSDWDRRWIEYARSKGIEVIFPFDLHAGLKLEEFAQICGDVALDLEGLVSVFEVGNEPNNFGDWAKTYGGTWNGREPDGSTSPWVLENLKYANAGAEAVKAVRPDAVAIGTGACSPTNIRYLDAGLSPAMEGVVDHPYTYSMPPEKVPFGLKLTERDGIAIGDDEHTFVGLMNSYMDHFRRTGMERTLWLTEFGFSTFRFAGGNETGLYAGFSEMAQAVYLLRRQLLVLGLPFIKASTQYDYIDDYLSHAPDAEANFGIVRADGSHKPAWYALQRFNSLLAETVPASEVTVRVTAEPLHRSMERGILVRDWDAAAFAADNQVLFQALTNPYRPQDRLLAVWSAQPYSGEFSNRAASLEIDGWSDAALPLLGIDLVTGRSFDVPARIEDGRVVIDLLELENHPLLLCF